MIERSSCNPDADSNCGANENQNLDSHTDSNVVDSNAGSIRRSFDVDPNNTSLGTGTVSEPLAPLNFGAYLQRNENSCSTGIGRSTSDESTQLGELSCTAVSKTTHTPLANDDSPVVQGYISLSPTGVIEGLAVSPFSVGISWDGKLIGFEVCAPSASPAVGIGVFVVEAGVKSGPVSTETFTATKSFGGQAYLAFGGVGGTLAAGVAFSGGSDQSIVQPEHLHVNAAFSGGAVIGFGAALVGSNLSSRDCLSVNVTNLLDRFSPIWQSGAADNR